ncbi:MAG: ABC transporter substrate-binding protein [Candidatus Thorarchaeota archaeon]
MSGSKGAYSVIGVLIVVIIVGAGFYIGFITLMDLGDITTTTTTTDSTSSTSTTPTSTVTTIPTQTSITTPTSTTSPTTTTTTITTTTTTTEQKTLYVLSRYDVAIHSVFEPAFLASSFALENNIGDIEWMTPDGVFWDDLIDMGQIDVCWGGPPLLFDQLMNDSLLMPLTSPKMMDAASRVNDTIAGTDMKRYDLDGNLTWIVSSLSSYGIVINHDFLTTYGLPVPANWTDLANITYASLMPVLPVITMANAPDSTSTKIIYHIILQALGWENGWKNITRMAGSANIYSSVVGAISDVSLGSAGIGLALDNYGFWAINSNPDCEYIVPQDGTLVQGHPIALAANGHHTDLGEGFIDFVLSPEGQALFLDTQRLPVMREAFDEPGLSGVEDLHSVFNQTIRLTSFDFNETLASALDVSVSRYFEAVMTFSHVELADCWVSIADAYSGGWIDDSELLSYSSLMAEPVTISDPYTSVSEKFTLDYAVRINDALTYDPSYRSSVQAEWVTAAKLQYVSTKAAVEEKMPFYESRNSLQGQNISIVMRGIGGAIFASTVICLTYSVLRRFATR